MAGRYNAVVSQIFYVNLGLALPSKDIDPSRSSILSSYHADLPRRWGSRRRGSWR
ncbi:hypothetical protein TUZN_2220 [Thermoproteus uzoniensis 768-20]|uniref:Uncharacterized protein n=1 Tax=Thermoproteus uzoniensis (strain 768-20) TaxID=999630 RepID=F2L659_THEU7|nr:hypothetical protein [Thermoproteus uzoniensis]AEA13675.1 hypothetical protein TUZN_2220 [Thermoproteus uzoniensis 768-20]